MRTRSWAATLVAALALGCAPSMEDAPPKNTLFVGIDVSGSFRRAHYGDAIDFAAHYIYGHMNGMGGLRVPTAMFVGSVGGEKEGETKAFHPIHDFQGKTIEQIAADLRTWFPPDDLLTDFNTFFDRVATLVKRQNLVLSPLNVVVLSDGVPDAAPFSSDTLGPYKSIDFSPLEYLSRSVTVRLLYPTPTVAVGWERGVERRRVRLWTLDGQVMAGWRAQVQPQSEPDSQLDLWTWIEDNVDFRVRSSIL